MMPSKQRPDPQKSLVGFAVGDVFYAIPIGCVREIINPITLTRLPYVPDAISGVADHRGEVVPIVDLRTRFGVPQSEEKRRRTKWILIHVGGRIIGLVVDSVTGVFGTGGRSLRPAPNLGGGEEVRGIAGVTSHDGAMVFVLDVDRLETIAESLQLNDIQLPAGSSKG
jgi:purine-binding chemotaxis protein CheW